MEGEDEVPITREEIMRIREMRRRQALEQKARKFNRCGFNCGNILTG